MKKVFGALSSVLAVGIFLFTCQTGKANVDMEIDENVYTIHQFTTFINEILVAQSVVLKHS